MKKITFLFLLTLMAIKGYGQCLGNYALITVASSNSGLEQEIAANAYTSGDFATITNMTVGADYTFTCRLGNTEKYITVTNAENVVIEHGPSPLFVSAINSTSVRVHYSDNEDCDGTSANHIVGVKIELSCPVPTGLEFYELGKTSALLAWVPQGNETTWEVIALPAINTAPANDLTVGVSVVNNNPEFTAVLLPGTSYKFYYRAVCSDTDKSPWNSSELFTTLCEEVSYFSEGFDGGTTLPNCFARVGTQGTLNIQNESTAASLPNVVVMGSGSILSLPVVSNYAANTNRLKFKLKCIYNLGGTIEFGYFSDPQNASSFVVLETFTANSLTEYDEYAFEPGDVPETGNFAFKHTGGSNWVVLDDVIWESIPSCPDITLLKTDGFTSTTASLSWIYEENASQIVYGVAATTLNPNNLTPQTVEENTLTLSNLEANTSYKVWVRSTCGEGTFGAWIGPKIITTTCAPVTTFSENFNTSNSIPACFKKVGNGGNAYIQSSSLYLSSYQNGEAMSYGMISFPPVSNAAAGTHRLKFTAKSSGSTGGVFELGYLTNPENVASFVAVQAFTSNSTTAETIIYIPTAGAINSEVLAFRHTGNPSYTVVIDDIVWETAPACGDVNAVQANNITNQSATISWTGNNETQWQVAYGTVAVTDPNTLTPIDVSDVAGTILSNLDASTTYKVWVRSNCGTAGFGAWIGAIEFSTACDPVTSFSENLNSSTNLPSCWTAFGGFMMTGSDNNFYYTTSLAVLALPQVSNASAGTHRLRFKAKAMYNLGGTIQVGYMTSYNATATFVPLQSYTPTSTTTFEEFYANLGSLPTTGYLAIRHNGVSFNAVAVDDVVWEPLPTCEEVGALAIDTFTNNTATIVWEAQYSTAWEIVYTEDNQNTDPSDLTPLLSDEETFTFTELNPDTVYKAWVRSVCDNGLYSAWVGPLEFKTTCDPIADLTWIEDFESAVLPDFPACWTKENGNWTVVDQTQLGNNPFTKTTPNSGEKYIRCYNGAVNDYMWTPGFELQANISYDFSTFVQGDGYDGWSVAMVYNTAPKSDGAVEFGEIYNIPTGTGIQPYAEMKEAFIPTVSGTYFFAVKVNENSTSNPFYIAFDDFSLEESNLSNPSFDNDTFIAYPNPVKDVLNLSYTENITDIAVFNLLGQQIITKTIHASKGQLDMSNLSAGSYLVKITADNQFKTIKIVKE